jgi:hypothetical protein
MINLSGYSVSGCTVNGFADNRVKSTVICALNLATRTIHVTKFLAADITGSPVKLELKLPPLTNPYTTDPNQFLFKVITVDDESDLETEVERIPGGGLSKVYTPTTLKVTDIIITP